MDTSLPEMMQFAVTIKADVVKKPEVKAACSWHGF